MVLRVKQNLRVFAYIVRRYNSAAESTSLLSSVASLAITSIVNLGCSHTRSLCYVDHIFFFGVDEEKRA